MSIDIHNTLDRRLCAAKTSRRAPATPTTPMAPRFGKALGDAKKTRRALFGIKIVAKLRHLCWYQILAMSMLNFLSNGVMFFRNKFSVIYYWRSKL
jgi:hypothetical protein